MKLVLNLLLLGGFILTLACVPIHKHRELNGVPIDYQIVGPIWEVGPDDSFAIQPLLLEWGMLGIAWFMIGKLNPKQP